VRRILLATLAIVALLPMRAELPTRPAAPPAPPIESVTIYLIARGDRGAHGRALGCGDSLVPATARVAPNRNRLQASVTALLTATDRPDTEPPLFNPLIGSAVTLEDIYMTRGVATLRLRGEIEVRDRCDVARITGQFIEALRAAGATRGAVLYLNDRSLAESLSVKE
jgi:hypothetical protein